MKTVDKSFRAECQKKTPNTNKLRNVVQQYSKKIWSRKHNVFE